jgi:hypothetical protein
VKTERNLRLKDAILCGSISIESLLALLYRRRDALDEIVQRLEQQESVVRESDSPVPVSRTIGHRRQKRDPKARTILVIIRRPVFGRRTSASRAAAPGYRPRSTYPIWMMPMPDLTEHVDHCGERGEFHSFVDEGRSSYGLLLRGAIGAFTFASIDVRFFSASSSACR